MKRALLGVIIIVALAVAGPASATDLHVVRRQGGTVWRSDVVEPKRLLPARALDPQG